MIYLKTQFLEISDYMRNPAFGFLMMFAAFMAVENSLKMLPECNLQTEELEGRWGKKSVSFFPQKKSYDF